MADVLTPQTPLNEAFNSLSNDFAAPEPARELAAAPIQAQPSGPVNVINPEGQLVSIDSAHLQDALQNGYQQATDQHVHDYLNEQKYGTPLEQLKTGLEGAASSATFGASTGLERALGAKPEDITGRRETNPGAHMLGQVAGLVGVPFIAPELAAATGLERAGAAAASALLPGAVEGGMIAKIGSAAAKGAVENALFQSGDEVSKMLASDPHQSVQTAIGDIGLAGILGGGISGGVGAVKPIWQATVGKNVDSFLNSFSHRLGGIDNVTPAIDERLAQAGMQATPEMKAALSGDPNAQEMFTTLRDSGSKSGQKAQEQVKEFHAQAADALVHALGKTPEEVNALTDLSERGAGEEIKDSLVKSLKDRLDPITHNYEKVSEKFKATPLDEGYKAALADKLGEIHTTAGSPESAAAKLVQRVIKEVPGIQNLEQLRVYTSGLANETSGIAKQELWGVGKQLKTALRDMEDKVLTNKIALAAPELIETHAAARSGYAALRNTIDELNDRLHVGAHGGPKTFINALKDMDGEAIIRRLSPKGRADIISELGASFPEVADKVRSFELDKLLKNAARASKDESVISPTHLFKGIENLSPEMRQFLISEDSLNKLSSVKGLLDSIPEKANYSGTAKALDKMLSYVPASAMGAISLLTGHNPVTGLLLGHMSKLLARDVPDAIRLSLLKFMGTSAPVNSAGFKAMVDMAQATIKGAKALDSGVKGVFKAGKLVLPQSLMPSESDINKLDKHLQTLQTDPQKMMNIAGETGHYLPDHAQAISETTARVVNYLNSQRPNTSKRAPLDPETVLSPAAKAQFRQTLTIAQQPLSVLPKIANGQLTSKDVKDMNAMYPDLCRSIQTKLTEQITEAGDKNKAIPYRTRMGLSVFMGQPLDSTLTPASIQAAQPKPQQQGNQQPGAPEETPKRSMTALNKLPSQYMTPEQTRAQRHQRG